MRLNLRMLSILFLSLFLLLSVATSTVAIASGGGGSNTPAKAADPDYAKAEKAIKAKDWVVAIDLLTKVATRDEKNADAYNYLGYAERNRGNLDVAFKYYERALSLDPKHLGVREYLGEAYLLAENLPKAEEQLAALDKLCTFSCSEYRELKEKIASYKQKRS